MFPNAFFPKSFFVGSFWPPTSGGTYAYMVASLSGAAMLEGTWSALANIEATLTGVGELIGRIPGLEGFNLGGGTLMDDFPITTLSEPYDLRHRTN